MRRKPHTRRDRQIMIVTNESLTEGAKQYRFRPSVLIAVLLLAAAVAGAGYGFFYYEGSLLSEKNSIVADKQKEISHLESEKTALQNEINNLNDTIQIMSETINQKTKNEQELTQKLEKLYYPSEFPLSGSATMDEVTNGEPACIFASAKDAMVVATASGEVIAINDDVEYGHNIWVDHGNGYVTIYKNSGDVKVKQGEKINQGATLFLIKEDGSRLCYQVMKENEYISPMSVLAISG